MTEYIVGITGADVKTVKELSSRELIEMLVGLPVRERIVRCMDCKHYDEIIHACDHPCVTQLRGDCPENWIFSCFDNDFCAWGVPREVDESERVQMA
jgi:hypothetical protein